MAKSKLRTGKLNEARVKGSTDDQLGAIRSAFREKYPDKRGPADEWIPGPWVRDTFLDGKYLVCEDKGTCYKVTFKVADAGAVTFAEPADWKEVYLTYAPVSESAANANLWVEAAGPRTGFFFEPMTLREAKLDEAAFVAKGVTLIRPGFSSNTDKAGRPRYYPAATLRASVAMFEGVRAFANHPRQSDQKDLPERSVRDITGYYQNVQAAADGTLTGDFHVVGEARTWLWPLITEAVVSKPDLVELSINALGVTKIGEAQGRKAVVVETIVGANSVDVVTTGAAGGSFAGALLASDGESFTRRLLTGMQFDEWRIIRPDYVNRLKAEWKTVRESDALKEAAGALKSLKDEFAALQAQYRADQAELASYRRGVEADRLLAGSKLPHTVRAKVRPELVEAKDDAAMEAVLLRETAKWQAAPKTPVSVSGAGQRPPTERTGTGAKPAHPAAVVFGLDEAKMARPNETAEAYKARRLQETAG